MEILIIFFGRRMFIALLENKNYPQVMQLGPCL